MRVVYIADDGTEYDNEYDCQMHENKNNKIIMLDEEGKELDSSNNMNIQSCYYIKIQTNKDLEILQKFYEYTGFAVPEKIGEFYYNYDNDTWRFINDRIKELKYELNKLKNIKEKLNGYQN